MIRLPRTELARAYQKLGQNSEASRWQHQYVTRQAYAAQLNTLWQELNVHPTDVDLHRQMARLLGLHADDGRLCA